MKTEDKEFVLYTLNYATKMLCSTTDMDRLIEISLDIFIEMASAEQGSIMLVDPESSELVVKMVKSDGLTIQSDSEIRLKSDRGFFGEMLKEAKPYCSNNPEEFCNLEDHLGKGAKSFLCIPLLGRENILGTTCLYTLKSEGFDQDTINLISALATQAGANIENIRLYKELEEWAKELETRVTERTKELEEANSKLKKIDQTKSEFLSTAAHELKTPLTLIKAIALTLLDNPDMEVDTKTEFLSLIDSEVDRLTRLINDILNLSKIEAGKLEWNDKEVSLSEIVGTSVKNLRLLASQKKIEIKIETANDLPMIIGDQERLMQV
ncbi:MAG: histidine kinase dimerization/phospho-acceptor domain-containing protein, partial [Candidatus Desantisbacteria bacterium]